MNEALGLGIRQGESAVVTRLLEKLFGVLPNWVRERVGNAMEPEILAWAERVLSAHRLD
jgi:hypothetical protein